MIIKSSLISLMSMTSTLLIALVIICFISHINCFGDNNDTDIANCNPKNESIPTLSVSSGALKSIAVNEGNDRKECVWIINGTNPVTHLDIALLSIGPNDLLTITDPKDNKIIYTSKGTQLPGVIFFDDKQKSIRVNLTLTADKFYREFNIYYDLNNTALQVQNIDRKGSFLIGYNTVDRKVAFNLTLRLSESLFSKRLLVEFETFELSGGKAAYDYVIHSDKYNVSDKPSFLLSDNDTIKIKITDFDIKNITKGVRLHYQLVDKVCSDYTIIEQKDVDDGGSGTAFSVPNATQTMLSTSYKCFAVYEQTNSTSKLVLDLKLLNFINNYDVMTVLDGNSRDSKSLCIINKEYMDYWKTVYLYTSSNKLLVLYDSPQIANKTIGSVLQINSRSQGGVITKDQLSKITTQVTLNKQDKQVPIVYVIDVGEGLQAVVDFSDNIKMFAKTQIFGSNTRNSDQLIELNPGEFPPDIMASNDNLMTIIFNQSDVKTFTFNIINATKGCHSSVTDLSTSYSLSGCQDICSWLIPKKASNGTFVLQFSNIDLPEATDSINIEMFSTKKTVLNLTGPFRSMSFPDINLDPNYGYVLYTKRQKCDNKSIDSSNLLAVSFLHVVEDLGTHTINTSISNETIQMSTQNYPNYYSVGIDHLWKLCGIENQTVLLTLTDMEVNHDLVLASKDLNNTFNQSTVLSQISDNIISLPLLINLTSHSIGSKSPFSGRGFTFNLTKVECGGTVNLEVNKTQTIPYTKSMNKKKCIWIVSMADKKLNTTLVKFNISLGKEIDDKNLKIYDSNSVRNNRLLNLKYFNDTEKMSSTNTIIIEYTISDKKDIDLNINLTTNECSHVWCGSNPTVCMLPQFFCNGYNDCGDWSDERNCNGSQPSPPPPPPPQPQPQRIYSGVNGWVVMFVIVPLCIGLGVIGTLYGPTFMGRFRSGRYREFQDFSEVS